MSYTFTWGPGPSEVIVTGTFDNWSKSFPLIKTPSGSFELTVPLPKTDDKILYKYVVDGEWVISPNAVIENDNGISNNVLYPSDLVSVAGADTVVPESGLPISNNNNNGEEKELKTTVLPSSENQQQTLGEPGIAIPANAASIDAFNTVSTVDPKSLNVDEQEEKEVPVAATISTSNPKNSKKKKKVKKSKKKVKKNGATTTSSKDASPGPESVTTSTTNENADVTETSEAASDVPEVVAADETEVAAPATTTTTTAVEEKEAAVPAAVEEKEEVAAPVVVEEAKEEHKTLDPASSVKTTEPVPESEIVGVEEVAPEDVAKLAEDEQIVAVEEVDDPETETSPVVKKDEEPIVKSEEPVAKKEEPKKTTPATTPAKKTTPTPAKKATPAKEEKKKGFFSKLKKLLS